MNFIIISALILFGVYSQSSLSLSLDLPTDLKSVVTKKPISTNSSKLFKYLKIDIANINSEVGLPVITKLHGRLGNLLFQLACAYSVAKKRNSDIYVLTPSVRNLKEGRKFLLDFFKINFSADEVHDNFTTYGSGRIFDFREQNIWEKSLPVDRVLRVNDICLSEVYFKEYRQQIKDMLVMKIDEAPVKGILGKIVNSESVAVHVRRGDYTKANEQRTLPISYQKRAMKWMERMVPNATFFVFSDDLEFVRKEFKNYQNVIIVDNSLKDKGLATLYDFLLMMKCKHNIIANSTFSWWAAYLNANKEKIVIGPLPRHPPGWNERRYRNKNIYKYRKLILDYYLYPADWLTINPFVS